MDELAPVLRDRLEADPSGLAAVEALDRADDEDLPDGALSLPPVIGSVFFRNGIEVSSNSTAASSGVRFG
jgi:hypothetical protein